MGDNAEQFKTQYGNISKASVGAIQRGLLTLDHEGVGRFFGEPALDIQDFLQTDGCRPRGDQYPGRRPALASPPRSMRRCCSGRLFWVLFEQLPEWAIWRSPGGFWLRDEEPMAFEDIPESFQEKIEQWWD